MIKEQKIELIKGIVELSSFPDVSLDLMAIINQFDLNFEQIQEKIKLDQALTLFLLKICNKSKPEEEVLVTRQAIECMGRERTQKELLGYLQRHLFTFSHKDRIKSLLWYHSIGVAVFTEKLCKMLQLDQEIGYTAGLLHDIGKQILILYNEYNFKKIIDQINQSEKRNDSVKIEKEIFQFDHTEVGRVMAENMNLPSVLVDAVRYHHSPDDYLKDDGILGVVSFANKLVQKVVEKKEINVNAFLKKYSITVAQMIDFSKTTLKELSYYLTLISD